MKLLPRALICCMVPMVLACATPRTLILTTPAASMTDASFDANTKLASAGEVKSQFCYGDESVTSKGESNIGLMDELIYKAQNQSGARYIANAQFFKHGNCLELEGTVMK